MLLMFQCNRILSTQNLEKSQPAYVWLVCMCY